MDNWVMSKAVRSKLEEPPTSQIWANSKLLKIITAME